MKKLSRKACSCFLLITIFITCKLLLFVCRDDWVSSINVASVAFSSPGSRPPSTSGIRMNKPPNQICCGDKMDGGKRRSEFHDDEKLIGLNDEKSNSSDHHHNSVSICNKNNSGCEENGDLYLESIRLCLDVPAFNFVHTPLALRMLSWKFSRGSILMNYRNSAKKLGYLINRKSMSTFFGASAKFFRNPTECPLNGTDSRQILALAHINSNLNCESIWTKNPTENINDRSTFLNPLTYGRPKWKLIQDPIDTYIGVYRDPLKRLVSGWVHKCVKSVRECYGCPQKDVHCFIRRNYNYMNKLSRNGTYDHYWANTDHFFPQNWAFDLTPDSLRSQNYLLFQFSRHPFDHLIRRLALVFNSFGIEAWKTDRIIEEMSGSSYEAYHATHSDPATAQALIDIVNNATTCTFLVRTYRYDYQIFQMDPPTCGAPQ